MDETERRTRLQPVRLCECEQGSNRVSTSRVKTLKGKPLEVKTPNGQAGGQIVTP